MSKGSGCCYVLVVLLVLATVPPPTTPTPSSEVDCSSRNSSCGECIGNVKCYFCYKDNSCRLYPASAVLPTTECPLSQVRWGATCSVSFEVLVIAVSVVAGVLGLALLYCCCRCWCSIGCCCCGGGGSGGSTWRDFKWSRDNRSNQMNPNNFRFWRVRMSDYDSLD
ncbi:pituitary tumor-transforming gene 1 protein-interacting protein-like [Branchiostoma lanceolatum]|uniref:pituitary tumor-transforming gene 1 protein-interacting protein-like n=1 Tax=Branchiostoma lanceolatum TaxID=7740 RepID=UPI003452CEEA